MKLLLFLLSAFLPVFAAEPWGPFRGANTRPTLVEKDFRDFAALGGNILRVSMATRPLMQRTAPYAIDEANFELLDAFLANAERHSIKVVIDPHSPPGTTTPFTTRPTDPFWNETVYQDHWVRLWTVIAKRYRDRGAVIAGYDLLNEPAVPNGGTPGTPGDWNALIRRLVSAIRAVDPAHTIIIEPPMIFAPGRPALNRLTGFSYLEAPPAANIVYSPHMYEPLAFTHQGVDGRAKPFAYPATIAGKSWDRNAVRDVFAPVLGFQTKHNVPIFMGEFSATTEAGAEANLYIRDILDLCEEYRWSWAYHAWRGAPVWNSEGPGGSSTPRLEMLKAYWSHNKSK